MKKHSERFTNAVTKLYNAFHENRLDAYDCKACAVGNICDNNDEWSDVEGFIAFLGFEIGNTSKGMRIIRGTGYSVDELINVERIFVDKCNPDSTGENKKQEEFNGLCAVIEYLCELEGIPNVMDYTKLFETENYKPKHQLIEVL